jgi:hypothetical protein
MTEGAAGTAFEKAAQRERDTAPGAVAQDCLARIG